MARTNQRCRALSIFYMLTSTLASPTHRLLRRATYDSSHKAGLSWTDTSVDVSQFTSKTSWYYDWAPTPAYPESAMDGIEYVPMFWGNRSISDWGNVQNLVKTGAVSHILGMNEPQTPGQSELSPTQAAELWMQYIQPLKQANSNIRLGSPAPSNGVSAQPWLDQFIGNCSACSIDFIALHWYYVNASSFIDYLNEMHDHFGKNIWVTEWACINFADTNDRSTPAEISALMNETQTFMENTDWLERYAWFGAFREMPGGLSPDLQLIDSAGKITALGKQYIGQTGEGNGTGNGGGGGGQSPGIASHNHVPTAFVLKCTLLTIASVLLLR